MVAPALLNPKIDLKIANPCLPEVFIPEFFNGKNVMDFIGNLSIPHKFESDRVYDILPLETREIRDEIDKRRMTKMGEHRMKRKIRMPIGMKSKNIKKEYVPEVILAEKRERVYIEKKPKQIIAKKPKHLFSKK